MPKNQVEFTGCVDRVLLNDKSTDTTLQVKIASAKGFNADKIALVSFPQKCINHENFLMLCGSDSLTVKGTLVNNGKENIIKASELSFIRGESEKLTINVGKNITTITNLYVGRYDSGVACYYRNYDVYAITVIL